MKPIAPKPMGTGKKKPGAKKAIVIPTKRLGTQSPKTPIPSGPRNPKATARPAPTGPSKSRGIVINPKAKKPSPSNKTNYGPLPKNPTLNDYLMRGIRPPMKIKPGLKRPSDSDVIIKGYNDKKYKGK